MTNLRKFSEKNDFDKLFCNKMLRRNFVTTQVFFNKLFCNKMLQRNFVTQVYFDGEIGMSKIKKEINSLKKDIEMRDELLLDPRRIENLDEIEDEQVAAETQLASLEKQLEKHLR